MRVRDWLGAVWLPACVLFFPLWIVLQIVSGRQGDAPEAALDEYEIQQRNSARSIGGCLPAMIFGWIRPNPDA